MEDRSVQKIDEKEFLFVFVDGVPQREGYFCPNIYFNVPITEQNDVDMRLLLCRDVCQILNGQTIHQTLIKVTLHSLDKSTTFATEAINKLARMMIMYHIVLGCKTRDMQDIERLDLDPMVQLYDAPIGDIIDPYIFSEDSDIVTIKAKICCFS